MENSRIHCFSPRRFKCKAAYAPENAVFYGDDVLASVAEDADAVPEVRRLAYAELLVRYMLAGKRDEGRKALLARYFGEKAVSGFCESFVICEDEGRINGAGVDWLIARNFCPKCPKDVDVLKCFINRCFRSDGFIPVFSDAADAAFLLPFHFRDQHGREPCVVDARGREVNEWSGYLRELPIGKLDVVVDVVDDGCFGLVGDSMMLPVMMAKWRRDGADNFPQYSVTRVFATGSLHGDQLGIVDVGRKLEKVKSSVLNGILLGPKVGDARRPFYGIAVNSGLEDCRRFVAAIAEERTKCSPRYMDGMLRGLMNMVLTTKGEDWCSVGRRLENLMAHVDRDIDPDLYLHGLMLRSMAACHGGDTRRAMTLNEEARDFSRGYGRFANVMSRLEVAQLVMLSDEERLSEAFELGKALGEKLEDKGEPTNFDEKDLLMRYHGTMAQLLTDMAIDGSFGGVSPESARCHCDRACRYAVSLYDRHADERTRLEAVQNIVQDYNYRVMIAAAFCPGRMDESAEEARRKAEQLSDYGDDGARSVNVNAGYRERFRLWGLYRMLLNGEDVGMESIEDVHGVVSLDDAEPWTRAMCAKYAGAIAAANGKTAEARDLFANGARLMENCGSGILNILKATIFAEEYRCFRNIDGCGGEVDAARSNAVECLKVYSGNSRMRDMLLAYFEDPDSNDYPGLKYWY